jgi:hypothetical protein
MVAIDPKKNKHLLEHYEGLHKYAGKLIATETGNTGDVYDCKMRRTPVPLWKPGLEDGWMEESTVANKLGLLMWSTDKILCLE